jgi:23S rRNA pseudouridine2605 synthase
MSQPQKPNTNIRLNKLIADSGLASRRGADTLIEQGLVTVNGKKVYELGIKVDPNADKVTVEGKPIRRKAEDPLERPTIKELLEDVPMRVFPIGRLDWDSEGLILLTNDGEYAQKVAHPTAEVTKTYLVKVDGHPKDEQLAKLKKGVTIEGGKVAAKSVERVKRGKDKYGWLKIVITEGKNRQIRQMFEKIGYDVLKLQRVAIGRLRIGNLERGQLVYLNDVAANRVFMPDAPDEVIKMKSYKDRQKSTKRLPAEKTKTKPKK